MIGFIDSVTTKAGITLGTAALREGIKFRIAFVLKPCGKTRRGNPTEDGHKTLKF